MPYFGVPIRNGLPIGLGSVAGFGAFQFSPSVLFTAGEQGAWYDPSDYGPTGTLFQDAAGTTPTMMETRVRLMLDKSKGLVLGANAVPEQSSTFSGVANGTNLTTLSGYVAYGAGATTTVQSERGSLITVASSSGIRYDNNDSANVYYKVTLDVFVTPISIFVESSAGTTLANITLPVGTSRSFYYIRTNGSLTRLYFRANSNIAGGGTSEFDNFKIEAIPGNHATAPSDASSPILRARYNLLLNSATLSTQSVTTVATGYVLRFEGAGSIALSGTASGTLNAGSHTITCTAGTLTLTVTGTVTSADLRTSTDAALNIPAYQSITTATSYDTNGFPPYLAFDGTDDSFSTASIDFTGTDEMTVFAGVTKLSDAAVAMLAELSADASSNNGAFRLVVPSAGNYEYRQRGTINATGAGSSGQYPAPITNVITGIGDISADVCVLRVNGSQVASSTSDQGTGNFGNYPLFIGRRNNSSLPFNGRLYSLIVRGASTTTPLIASTESWVAGKMRLPI